MALKHLIVHMDASDRAGERLDLSIAVARRFGARLTGLFAEIESLGASIVGRRSPLRLEQAEKDAHAAFEAKTTAAGVATEWWHLEPGEYSEVIGLTAVCCRYADLAIFGQHDPADARVPEDMVERVVLDCGRPVLVVPSVGHYPDVGKRVLIAWNGSREAARALNDGIPLMQGAEAVVVVAMQDPTETSSAPMPPLDVVAHLAAHGINAQYERIVKGEFGAADTLLNRSFDLAADLTVMGYGQYGIPLLQRASSAREILRSMTTPVLLSN